MLVFADFTGGLWELYGDGDAWQVRQGRWRGMPPVGRTLLSVGLTAPTGTSPTRRRTATSSAVPSAERRRSWRRTNLTRAPTWCEGAVDRDRCR